MNATESKDKKDASWKQMIQLAMFIAGVLGEIFNADQIQEKIRNKGKLRKDLLKFFEVVTETYAEIREEWQKFYQSELGMEVDLSGIQIPEKPEGDYRLIFIAKGLTPNKVFDSWKFPKWRYSDDLDKVVTTNKRTANESYAIWVLAGDEPDQEFLGKSTKTADPNMEIGMTLLECTIFESKYFAETDKHLDIEGVTFCSGSRNSDGNVPHVYLGTCGKVYVGWCGLDGSDSRYGVRRAVTL